MIDYENFEHLEIVRGVLEELADSLPEVRETDLWRENMPVTITSWNQWNIIEHEQDYRKINQWFSGVLENFGIGSSIELLGGGAEGVSIYGETLHALFTVSEGLGIYANGDETNTELPKFIFPMDASTRLMYSTPSDYARAMAELLGVTLFANENFGGK